MIVFLQNALGFFVQFFPCAIMIFLPFPKEAYRFKQRNVFISVSAASAVFSIIFAAVLCLRDIEKYPMHITISNSFMLAAVLLILAAYVWIVRGSVIKKVMVFFVVMFYAATEFVAVNTAHSLLIPPIDTMHYPYTDTFLIMYILATAVLLPIMIFAVIRPLKDYILMIEPKTMRREFIILILSTTVYFILAIYFDTQFGKMWQFLEYLPMLVLLTINQVLIYWLVFRESVRRKRDSDSKRAMEIQQLQYEKIVSDMDSTRRMRHDMRHHYTTLISMLDSGQTDKIKDYLSKLINTTVNRESEVYCKNMTVNGLLQYYVGLAKDEGISCEIHAECDELSIEPDDLTVVFGNAMENAIRSCRKCGGDSFINVQVGTVQGSLAMEISNSCKSVNVNRRFLTENGFSPAEAFVSDTNGGYGLSSIAHTAKKYGGSAAFRFNADKEIFTTRVRLNLHTDE